MCADNTNPLKILLVEDEPIVMMVNRKQIELLGYKPDTAVNGGEALALAANNYDIIFMDIGLPDIDGIAVTRQIRESETEHRARIIAVTGYTMDEVRDKCLDAGMDDVASKPISIDSLEKFIRQAASA